MVETDLHPRPSFYTFLRSDTCRGGDGLTYHDYQRAVRSNKVAILQQRRAMSYEPGLKKPGILKAGVGASATRKIFQLKSKNLEKTPYLGPPTAPPPATKTDQDIGVLKQGSTVLPQSSGILKQSSGILAQSSSSILKQSSGILAQSSSILKQSSGILKQDSTASLVEEKLERAASSESVNTVDETDPIAKNASNQSLENITLQQSQTERLPRISKKPRLVKSATSRDLQLDVSCPSIEPKRPRSACGTRDIQVQTLQSELQEGKIKV